MKNVFHIVTDEEANGILGWQEAMEGKADDVRRLDEELKKQGIYFTCYEHEALKSIHDHAWRMLGDMTRFRRFIGIARYRMFRTIVGDLVGEHSVDRKLTREDIDAVNYELTWREGHYVEIVAQTIEEKIFGSRDWRSSEPLKMRPLKNAESFRSSDLSQDSDAQHLFDAVSLLETGELQEYPEQTRDGRWCRILDREHSTIYFTASGCQNGNIRLKLTPRGKAVLTELFNTFPYVERKAA